MKYFFLITALMGITYSHAQMFDWGILTDGRHNYLNQDSAVYSVEVGEISSTTNLENRMLVESGLDWGGNWQIDSAEQVQLFGEGLQWQLPLTLKEDLEWDFTSSLTARCTQIEWRKLIDTEEIYDSVAYVDIEGGNSLLLAKEYGIISMQTEEGSLRLYSIENSGSPSQNLGKRLPYLHEYFLPENGIALMTDFGFPPPGIKMRLRFAKVAGIQNEETMYLVRKNVAEVTGYAVDIDEVNGYDELVYGEASEVISVTDTLRKDTITVLSGDLVDTSLVATFSEDLYGYLSFISQEPAHIFLNANGRMELFFGDLMPGGNNTVIMQEGVGVLYTIYSTISPRSSRGSGGSMRTEVLDLPRLLYYQTVIDRSLIDYSPAINHRGQLLIDADDEIYGIKADSVIVQGDTIVYHLMKSINQLQDSDDYQFYGDSWMGDKILQLPNGDLHFVTHDYFANGEKTSMTIEIRNSAQLGDQWTSDGVDLRLDSIFEHNGDSVKVFHVVANGEKAEFWLGKHQGIWKAPTWEIASTGKSSLPLAYEDEKTTFSTLERVDNMTKGAPIGRLDASAIYDLQVGDEVHFWKESNTIHYYREMRRVLDVKSRKLWDVEVERTITYERCIEDRRGQGVHLENDSVLGYKDTVEITVELLDTVLNVLPYEHSKWDNLERLTIIRAYWDEEKGNYSKEITKPGIWTVSENGIAKFLGVNYLVFWKHYVGVGAQFTDDVGAGVHLQYRNTQETEWGIPFLCAPTGKEEIVRIDFGLYPNPSDGSFAIRLEENQQADMEVYDAEGRIVRRQAIQSGEQIDLDLMKGIYLIKVMIDESQFGFRKLIITD